MKEKNIIFASVSYNLQTYEALNLLISQSRNNNFRKFYNTTLYVNDHSVNRFMEKVCFFECNRAKA